MRYRIVVSRVQTAEHHVRAVSEEDAIRKIQDEPERPYGFLGGWTTVGTDLDIVAVESALGDHVPAPVGQDGAAPVVVLLSRWRCLPTLAHHPGAPKGDFDAYLKACPDLPYPGFAQCFANGLPLARPPSWPPPSAR